MKLKSLLTVAALATSLGATAQTWITDSVIMNGGYINDNFYSLQNGSVSSPVNNDWHLAFQMTPPGPYGNVSVLANHAQTNVQVYNMHVAATANFSNFSGADTAGKTSASMQLYNADSNWNYGAFNRTVNAANPFNYSWGTYDMSSHNVNGDSIYVIKVGNPVVAYKLFIQQYMAYPADSVKWKFKIAKLDNTDSVSEIIRPAAYPNRLFAYYNATTKTVSDREPVKTAWDILFTRYKSEATQGGITLMTNTTGVFSNAGVSVADVRNVNADTTTMTGRTFTTKLNEIGSDWKINVPMTANYYLDSTATFFVKTVAGAYWQIKFTGFAATNGRTVFQKRQITTTSINSVNNNISNYYAAPNPANNAVNLMIETKEATPNAQLAMVDMSGRVVSSQIINTVKGLNAYNINTANVPAGIYFLSVTGQNIKLTQKVTVAH